MTQPYEECPRYMVCSCNTCPLDPDVGLRFAMPGEEVCKAFRSIRERIAKKYPDLPWHGLTLKEQARERRRAAWAALPADDPRKILLLKGRRLFKAKNATLGEAHP